MINANWRLGALAALALFSLGAEQAKANASGATEEGEVVTEEARGTFEVSLNPIENPDNPVGALSIDKTFQGDLQAHSTGQMLAIRTAVEDSAGYVAMETLTATLDGKTGGFSLQHSGTMNRGAQSMQVSVVPDSGTGDLTGIAGDMEIIIEGGEHKYVFHYTLPD